MGQSLIVVFLVLAGMIHWVSVSDDQTAAKLQGGGSVSVPSSSSSETMAPVESKSAEPAKDREAAAKSKTYAKPPEMTINAAASYQAVLHTNKGDFTMELFPQSAPVTVNNFVFLAREGFYDDVVFHRIIQSFMVQTGDPTGTGSGGPGYRFKDELNSPYKYEPGIVAMANSGPNTNGSQFFICTGEDSSYLNQMPNYTIFGKVTDGMDTVLNIAGTPVTSSKFAGEKSSPTEEVVILSIDIMEGKPE
ncbi:peptidylprolyl isomerase [Paenibacillus sp. NPDC056579]|uniref:peptidylprolyl isomerase n=1 Tax=Paenibacillus sp. NPDC056579 TaxID=3345871 RepID=UPI0036A03020